MRNANSKEELAGLKLRSDECCEAVIEIGLWREPPYIYPVFMVLWATLLAVISVKRSTS